MNPQRKLLVQRPNHYTTESPNKVKSKVNTDIAVRNRNCHTATGNHMPYVITQCYLPPDRGDFSAFIPSEAGTRFSDLGGMQGRVDLGGGYLPR